MQVLIISLLQRWATTAAGLSSEWCCPLISAKSDCIIERSLLMRIVFFRIRCSRRFNKANWMEMKTKIRSCGQMITTSIIWLHLWNRFPSIRIILVCRRTCMIISVWSKSDSSGKVCLVRSFCSSSSLSSEKRFPGALSPESSPGWLSFMSRSNLMTFLLACDVWFVVGNVHATSCMSAICALVGRMLFTGSSAVLNVVTPFKRSLHTVVRATSLAGTDWQFLRLIESNWRYMGK